MMMYITEHIAHSTNWYATHDTACAVKATCPALLHTQLAARQQARPST
jgi:hypothetical protein